MNKISVTEAIAGGAWYECKGMYFDEDLHFRLRVLGFSRTTIEEIDASLVDEIELEGILWLMSVEVVNLCKKPVDAYNLKYALSLLDEDGYEFEHFPNSDLRNVKARGINRFSGKSLSPKIKAVGAIPFVLPDEENKYYLVIKEGQILEA